MPQFDYIAKDSSGKATSGRVTATTEKDAVRALQGRGYSVTSLMRQAEAGIPGPVAGQQRRAPSSFFTAGVRPKELSIFFRELYTMLNAGITLYRALELQSQTTASPRLKLIIRNMAPRVQGGEKLSNIMESYPQVFNKLILGLVRAGETTGGLDAMCRLLADYLEKEHRLREKIKRETLYPKLLSLAIVFIPTVPTLVVKGPLAWLSELLGYAAIATPFVLCGGALWFAHKQYRQTLTGKSTIDALKLKLPLFGKVIRRLSLAKFCRATAALYKAGIGYLQALPTSADACGNEAIADSIRSAVPKVQEGQKLSEILKGSDHFHPMVIQMMVTGEETGNMDAMLDKVADYFEAEADTATHQMTVTLTPILIIIAAMVIGMKVIQFYTGMYNFF